MYYIKNEFWFMQQRYNNTGKTNCYSKISKTIFVASQNDTKFGKYSVALLKDF